MRVCVQHDDAEGDRVQGQDQRAQTRTGVQNVYVLTTHSLIPSRSSFVSPSLFSLSPPPSLSLLPSPPCLDLNDVFSPTRLASYVWLVVAAINLNLDRDLARLHTEHQREIQATLSERVRKQRSCAVSLNSCVRCALQRVLEAERKEVIMRLKDREAVLIKAATEECEVNLLRAQSDMEAELNTSESYFPPVF